MIASDEQLRNQSDHVGNEVGFFSKLTAVVENALHFSKVFHGNLTDSATFHGKISLQSGKKTANMEKVAEVSTREVIIFIFISMKHSISIQKIFKYSILTRLKIVALLDFFGALFS